MNISGPFKNGGCDFILANERRGKVCWIGGVGKVFPSFRGEIKASVQLHNRMFAYYSAFIEPVKNVNSKYIKKGRCLYEVIKK